MKKPTFLYLLLILSVALSACGPSQADLSTQTAIAETSIAASWTATPNFSVAPVPITETPTAAEVPETEAMILIPVGEFTMGSDIYDDEKPIHTITLDAYYMDKYEVTNAAYKRCVDSGLCIPPKESRSFTRPTYYGNSEFDDYPVIYVNWNMAKTYCEWRGSSLPTEAQWEKAARGTDGRTYPWGENIDCDKANYQSSCVGDTSKVGTYASGVSPYGIYDMAGNVWEWVNDLYNDVYYQSSPSSNPMGPSSGQYRVLRGGSWFNSGDVARSAFREVATPGYNYLPGFNFFVAGFRCIRSLP